MKKISVAGLRLKFVKEYRRLVSTAKSLRMPKHRAALIIIVVVSVLALGGYSMFHVSADTAILVPNGDITAQWATGGTSDGSCAAGGHCNYVDEGAADKTTDYVTTSGLATGTETEEYALSTVNGVSSASQVVVRIYAQTTTVQGTADTLTVNLRVNGTLQTAGSCTPGASYAACTVTFTGSWTQADVDSMQIYIQRVANGTGATNKKVDTINIANVYATLTYVPTLQQTQSAYRWFDNQDATSQTTFVNTWGSGTSTITGNGVVGTSDGGYAVVADNSLTDATYKDIYVAKFNAKGVVVWQTSIGTVLKTDNGKSIIQTSDGGFAVVGYTSASGAGGNDMFLVKVSSGGAVSWSRTWGGTGDDYGQSLTQTSDGGYVVTGYTNSFSAGDYNMFLTKYDGSGNLSWSNVWGGSSTDQGNSVIQTSDGGFAVTGYTDSYGGTSSSDVFLAKYDSGGNLLWSRVWGGLGDDTGKSVAALADGGLVVTGYTTPYGSSYSSMLIIKYSAVGTLAWGNTWGASSNNSLGNSIVKTDDGGFAVTGTTSVYGAGGNDMFLAKYDSNGGLGWSKTWGGTGTEQGNSIARAADGGFVITGITSSYGAGNVSSLFLAKYDINGSIAGCTSPMCQSPVAATGSPVVSISSPTASTSSPAASSASASPASTSVSPTATTVVTLSMPSIAAGTPRAATNAAMTAPDEGTIFRLRLNIHMSGSTVNANAANLKLQYAPKSGSASCSVVPTGNFLDVTDSSTIRYADNPLAATGINLTTNVSNDPVHGTDTNIAQAYYEKGTTTFTNPNGIASGQDGMWDFALQTSQTLQNTSYCLRVVQAGGTLLDTYSVYPELTTTSARFTQAAYRWFDPSGAVGGPTTFVKGWGTSSDAEDGNSIIQTSDGGYAIAGDAGSGGLISKYNAGGSLLWARSIPGSTGYTIVQTSDGGYAVGGRTSTYGAGIGDLFLSRFDSTGNLLWYRTWGGSNAEYFGSMVQTSDGGFAMVGSSYSFDATEGVVLTKFDSSGITVWSRTWSSSVNTEAGYSIAQMSDGGYIITGDTASFGSGQNDVYYAKYDSSGNLLWSYVWGGAKAETGYSVIPTSDGGFAIAGSTNSFGVNGGAFGSGDAFIAKFNGSGALTWSRTWGGTGTNDRAYSLIQTSDGGFAITGDTNSFGLSGDGVFLAKYDANGNLGWSRTWGGQIYDIGSSLVQTSDGGYAIAGTTQTYGSAGSNDVLLLKYDSAGNISGCTSPMCQSPTATTSTPSATPSSVSVTATTPAATNAPQTLNSVALTGTSTDIVISPVPLGAAQSPQNKPLDMANLVPTMLRIAVRVDGSGVDLSTQNFKLQYAIRTSEASCQVVSSGLFADIGASTPLVFYDDSRYANGQAITESPNDPSDGSRTNVAQNYVESNSFANSQSPIYAGQNGMWQFSLTINNATLKGRNLCLRIAKSDNTVLSALNVADVAYAPQMEQKMRGGTWFDRGTGKKQVKVLR